MYSPAVRTTRNIAADSPSRSSPLGISHRALFRNMDQINPMGRRAKFCDSILPPWPDRYNVLVVAEIRPDSEFLDVEWQPVAYTLREAGRALAIPRQWIDPRHTRIARQFSDCGHTEFLAGSIHFFG